MPLYLFYLVILTLLDKAELNVTLLQHTALANTSYKSFFRSL